jgi:REP element-mobilizing transposase RayT
MARSIRLLDNESGIVEVVSRTIQGRYLTRPSAEVNDLILGVVGRAQAKYGVEIFALIFMSNHFHMLMRAESARRMADFVRFVKSNIARELQRLHGWRGTFWGGRYSSIPLDDEELETVLSERFFYILSNGCKEDLVYSPLEWPGVSSAHALYHGETTLTGTWYDRTAENDARLRGEHRECRSTETVALSPLPFLEDVSEEQRRQWVVNAVREIEEETRERHRVNGTRPAGADSVLRRHPHDSPEAFESSPAPWFHCVSRERYLALRAARALTVAAYREAAARLKTGDKDVEFPEGTFPPPAPFVEVRGPPQ